MDNEPVAVATVQGEVEEQQLRAFLEAHGISTVVRGEALRKTHAFVLDGLGAVTVLVPPEHAEAARDLLARVDSGELELASELDERCQARDDSSDESSEPGTEPA